MVSLVSPGFAIRRPSRCLGGLEVDCGNTGNDGFHACCPSSLICPGPQYNAICCPAGASDCTEKALAAQPQPPCANATWDMFDNGGYFCCAPGVQGYNKSNTNWCGRPSQVSVSAEVQTLSLVRGGVDPATVLASLSSASTASGTPRASQEASVNAVSASASPTSSASASEPSSSTPVGAIAGGVIGGIAALSLLTFLVWFFLRRRRQQQHDSTPELPGDAHMAHEALGSEKYASSGSRGGVYEVGGHESTVPVAEMAADQRPVELDGTERGR